VHYQSGGDAGQIAFLFPGQGSQYVAMGAELAITFDAARAAWDEAANAKYDGVPLHDVVFPRPVFSDAERDAQTQKLMATEWAQPGIGVASLATFNVLAQAGVVPALTAGHSFGELTALAAAGGIDHPTFFALARKRGEAMRDAAKTPGAMAAVAATLETVKKHLAEIGADVVVANHNHPTQVVVSGGVEAIDRAIAELGKRGVTAKKLSVATAFHSPIVATAGPLLGEALERVTFTKPSADVFSNVDALPIPFDPAAIRTHLAEAIAKPVRFVEEIEAMWARGARTFVEVGPGAVLTDLVARILEGKPHVAIATDRKGKHGVTALQEALGRLSIAGVAVDYAPLWADVAPPAPPKKKPAMTIGMNGANIGKPYPPPGGAAALPKPNPPRSAVAPAAPAKPVAAPAAAPAPAAKPASNGLNGAHAPVAPALAAAPAPSSTPIARPAPTTAMTHNPAAPAPTLALAPASAPVAHALPASAHAAWVHAYQESQRQTAEAHAAYLTSMAATHTAFLQTVEASFMGLGAILGGQPVAYAPRPVAQPMPAFAPAPITYTAPVAAYAPPPQPAPAYAPPPVVAAPPPPPAPVVAAPPPPAPVIAPTPAPAPVSAPAKAAPATADLEALMLAIVAEKTGYPADMLGMGMELEADLGVDSIKRVEILSTMRERAPGLPEVVASEMAALRTLGQIVDYLRAKSGAPAAAAPPAPAAAAAVAQPAAPAGAPADLEGLMLGIVAEKTGYPADMLGMQMELEADLGIDSIKRVEILSTMRERAPGLPEVVASEMAALRTLGQIVDYMRSRASHGGPRASSTTEAVAADPPSTSGVTRFVVEEEPAAACGLAIAGLVGAKKLVVTDEGTGVAQALAVALAARGVAASVVASVPADADAVVFLGGLRATGTVDDAVAVNREAFAAAKAVAARFAADGGLFVTVQDTGGDFGLAGSERAWSAGVSALARTVAIEWTKASVKAIDIERGGRDAGALAAAIADELFHGGPTREVGLHADGRRTTLASNERAVVRGTSPVDASSVVVVSGGARGVTAACVIELARRTKARVVLLGRSKLEAEPAAARGIGDDAGLKRALLEDARKQGKPVAPAALGAAVAKILANREIDATLAAIRGAGSDVRYVAADVQDGAAIGRALDEVRAAWGPITGFVHGAGVLADKLVAEKTPEQFDRVFDTKVAGLRALLAATASDPIRFVALFSSIAARTGNLGQSDYAMANEVLNKVAASMRRASGGALVAKSIGWGPWEGGMVTPALEARFTQMGVKLIPIAEGARRFVDELAGSPDEVETVVGGAVSEGPLGAGPGGGGTRVELTVSRASMPVLDHHRVAGRPVVPVAMAIEWMARAARAARPEATSLALRDVRVLRGIKLEHFENGGDRFAVTCTPKGDDLAIELRGAGGALHYSATLGASAAATTSSAQAPGALRPWAAGGFYDGHLLFHGPAFQVIRTVDGVSREGLIATLDGARARGWQAGAWRTDPAVVDGALQLALLWAREVLGGATLPMAVGGFEGVREGLADGATRAVLRAREVHASRAVCDVVLEDAAGSAIAVLRGVETVLRPGEAAAS
jgi:acyl transferase domain-containing protein